MIILHKNNYNPKLDFLICKNLLKETPRDCDELDFKDCFFGRRKPLHFHEKQIVKVKKFFKTHNILKLSRWDIRVLYRIITGSKEKISFGIICPINSPDDIVILANLVRSTNITDKYTLFRILLVEGYCLATRKVIVPYRWMCKRMLDSVELGDDSSALMIWKHIHERTNEYFEKHDAKENVIALNQVATFKDDFLSFVSADRLMLFGSLAIGKGNEYSDVDLIAIFPDERDLYDVKAVCRGYWEEKLSISFDIIVIHKSEFDALSHPAIKRTLKEIGGCYDVA